jgi:hypothetical protein
MIFVVCTTLFMWLQHEIALLFRNLRGNLLFPLIKKTLIEELLEPNIDIGTFMFIMLGRVAPSTACHAANFESSLVSVSVLHHCRTRCVNCRIKKLASAFFY